MTHSMYVEYLNPTLNQIYAIVVRERYAFSKVFLHIVVVESTVVDMACVVVAAEHLDVELGSVGRPEIIICMFWIFSYAR